MTLSRRQFIHKAAAGSSLVTCLHSTATAEKQQRLAQVEARHYNRLPDKEIQCQLCPWRCTVKPGRRGRCQARQNIDGRYYSLIYGQITAIHSDPIEKKPFYHFLPGTQAFSMATSSCNFDCKFCQNWTIARRRPEDLPSSSYTPEAILDYAGRTGATTIAYTYNEPTIYQEFIADTTRLAKERNLNTVLISNGFINKEPLEELAGLVNAYKVDLKSFSSDYYLDVVHGRLQPVLDTLIRLKKADVWTEIVCLTVPTLNDDPADIHSMADWIIRELGPDVPVHFTRFIPKYKLKNLPPTPVRTLEKLRDAALSAGLHYVYIGNVPGHEGSNTYCHNCGKLLIGRAGYTIYEYNIASGACGDCSAAIPGVWE